MSGDDVSVVFLSSRYYPLACLDAARSAFADTCGAVIRLAGDRTEVRIRPREGVSHLVVNEFLNFALLVSLEQHLDTPA